MSTNNLKLIEKLIETLEILEQIQTIFIENLDCSNIDLTAQIVKITDRILELSNE